LTSSGVDDNIQAVFGAVAQLGEHNAGSVGVRGSTPLSSIFSLYTNKAVKMKKIIPFLFIVSIFTGYVQAQPVEYQSTDSTIAQHKAHHSRRASGQAAGKAEIFIFRSINYFVLVILASVFLIGGVFLYSFLHRKSPVCSAEQFLKSDKLEILASDEGSVVIYPQDPAFNLILSNFSDDFHEPKEALSVPLRLTIGMRRYTIEVSDVGWNFKGEPHGLRRIKDALALVQLLNNKINEKFKK
jgi:hypothetical protein